MNESERLASIRFGNTRFYINLTNYVDKFLKENGADSQKLVPTAPSWYTSILESLGLTYNDETEIEVLFLSIKGKEQPKIPEGYKASFESPLRFQGKGTEKEVTIKFLCKIAE
ncbi:MAG: hypothetical protein ABEI74_05005 [Candidatus Pacearchaeota archaeon]